jgi:hypothetical protein
VLSCDLVDGLTVPVRGFLEVRVAIKTWFQRLSLSDQQVDAETTDEGISISEY